MTPGAGFDHRDDIQDAELGFHQYDQGTRAKVGDVDVGTPFPG
jgi:hypothetical protein